MRFLLPLLILISSQALAVHGQWVYSSLGGDKIAKLWKRPFKHKVIVAIVDSGVEYTHPDLKNNIWKNKAEINGIPGIDDDQNGYIDDFHGYDIIDGDNDPMDTIGHGTHVAGIVAATKNNFGVTGVAPNALIMPVKAFNKTNSHPKFGAEAIRYAVDNGADIINCSWVEREYNQDLEDAIEYALSLGVIVVSSAGNDGESINDLYRFPSTHPEVIAVANLDFSGQLSKSSNYGDQFVDIAAPGTSIQSTYLNGSYKYLSGSSMAAPFVSGAIALLLSIEPDLKLDEIRDRLYRNGKSKSYYKRKIRSMKRIDVADFVNNKKK